MGKLVPVKDPERVQGEQSQQDLRRHRHFDAPFSRANLSEDRDAKAAPKDLGDAVLGRRTGEVELDDAGLWRKKKEVFDKDRTVWGREAVEYSNPEETREGQQSNWNRPGTVAWGTQGSFGNKEEDRGQQVIQRGEVEQTMVKNEKGLWVRVKSRSRREDLEEVPEGMWRCIRCKADNINKRSVCKKCDFRHDRIAETQPRSTKSREDPRLEAAKQKGRGTKDAAREALQALEERRRKQVQTIESGISSSRTPVGGFDRVAGAVTMNSSSQQVRPAKRNRKHKNWQGVQHNEEEARMVVGKAEGTAHIGKPSTSVTGVRFAFSNSSQTSTDARDLEGSGGSDSGGDGQFAWQSDDSEGAKRLSPQKRQRRETSLHDSPSALQKGRRSRSCSRSPAKGSESHRETKSSGPSGDAEYAQEVVVDFF